MAAADERHPDLVASARVRSRHLIVPGGGARVGARGLDGRSQSAVELLASDAKQMPSPAAPAADGPSGSPGADRTDRACSAVLAAEQLTKIYSMGEVQVHALRGVDFALYAGEFMVLLGASGSGKSTLLNILGGLDVPTAGRLLYRGRELTGADADELTSYRRNHVGFVFQFYNLIPSLTARENVALVTEIAPDPLDPADALDLVGLGARLDHFPSQLSGGEQQRVAIARAVAKQPALLLCDEPTGALDFRTGVVVLDVLTRVNRELGTTTAVITHNAPVAAIADRVVNLADGLVQSDRPNERRLRPCDISW
jgi:putative ABC transport system ATP-binding protein